MDVSDVDRARFAGTDGESVLLVEDVNGFGVDFLVDAEKSTHVIGAGWRTFGAAILGENCDWKAVFLRESEFEDHLTDLDGQGKVRSGLSHCNWLIHRCQSATMNV